jgi:hypothetical protein
MRALMTNIEQVNIWVEAEAVFNSITDADGILRIVAGVGICASDGRMAASASPFPPLDPVVRLF